MFKNKEGVLMKQITITYNHEEKSFTEPINLYQISQAYQIDHPMAAIVEREMVSLQENMHRSCSVEFIDLTKVTGYKIYQNGLKYLFITAVNNLFKNNEVRFLHSVPKGILAEVCFDRMLTKEDVGKIKGQMAKIVSDKEPLVPYHLKPEEAYQYLLKKQEPEKAKMIPFLSHDLITMYRLKNNLNNFYTIMPYDTSLIDRFDLKYIGKNQVVLVCPNIALHGQVPEYVHYENIIANFTASQKWLRLLNTPYLAQLNQKVADYQIKDFIEVNELKFSNDILEACEAVLDKPDVKFVLIAGPSSSGKTTTTKRLGTFFKSHGYEPILLSTDDFFVNKVDTPKDEFGEYNFECLQAIDLDTFNQVLKQLLNGEEVDLPEYDFVQGIRIYKGRKAKLKENSIVLIEGLHCLNDDLLPFIEAKYKYKIYLSPFMPLSIDRHNYISTLDLRLIRRITRDRRSRGKKVEDTINEWKYVRKGEEEYIFPYIYQADKIINTALAYEMGVLKVYALPLLHSVTYDSVCYSEARRLIKMFEPYFTITSELVPKDSILREFIG